MRSSSAALLVCDERMLRDLFAENLRTAAPDLTIVEAASLSVADFTAVPPGSVVIFIDCGGNGDQFVETISASVEQLSGYSIAVVSSFRGNELKQLNELRLNGYISTNTPAQILVHTLRLLLAGGDFMSPVLISALTHGEREPFRSYANKAGHRNILSQREHAVLRRLQQGKPNKVIGAELQMEENAVKTHLRGLMRKFGAHNRVELVLATTDIRTDTRREES